MPELPEVETTCKGIRPYLDHATVTEWIVREPRLRWPVSEELNAIPSQSILSVQRRAKYILIHFSTGAALVHLGMSGSLRIANPNEQWKKHDHIAITLSTGKQLRYHDPRRFGCWLWAGKQPLEHPLLQSLGPEPIGEDFTADYLFQRSRQRKTPIKALIMDASIVVGVGNIYACEALHMAGIHPGREAGKITRTRIQKLKDSIRQVLEHSITQGGTTLRDFVREDGTPGYFKQQLRVYGREGEACNQCQSRIRRIVQGQRSTFFCPRCQS
jgi:formamidopyrimidine-DNA glycosylase